MTTSIKPDRMRAMLGRLVAMLTMGLLLLNVSTATVFAANGAQASNHSTNAAPGGGVGGGVTLDADDDDDDDEDDDEEGGGGGGLPATDTAPELSPSTDSNVAVPAIAVLVITGLAGGALRLATKRTI